MFTCPEDDIHSIYADGELPKNYVAEYEAHVNSCPKCSAKLKKFLALNSVFAEDKENFIVPMNITKDKVQTKGGVKVLRIAEDNTPFTMVYDPEHPDANDKGYVAMPNVNTVKEMVDMITATRAYEANATVITNAKSMATSALSIGK